MPQRLAGLGDQVGQRRPMSGQGFRLKVAGGQRGVGDGGAVFTQACNQQATKGLGAVAGITARGAEIEQHHPAGVPLIAVIGKIGVGLHALELEHLAHKQAEQQRDNPVALCLRRVLQ